MFTFEFYWSGRLEDGAIMNFYGDSNTAYFNYDEYYSVKWQLKQDLWALTTLQKAQRFQQDVLEDFQAHLNSSY